jgi:GTP-binding protein
MKSVAFIRPFFSLAELPKDGLPEVACIGRSNVGKSSLINALADRKNLARISSTPGKTQSLNYYKFDDAFYLVDMPGYGFAKEAKTKRMEWNKLIESYMMEREELRTILLLIDSRHAGLDNDMLVADWLEEYGKPWCVVLTKMDKVTQSDLAKHQKFLQDRFKTLTHIWRTSSETGRGIRELRGFLASKK